jgi:hypothetical protein
VEIFKITIFLFERPTAHLFDPSYIIKNNFVSVTLEDLQASAYFCDLSYIFQVSGT